MRHLPAAVLALALIAMPAIAADPPCQTANWQKFQAANAQFNPQYRVANRAALGKVLALMNHNRAAARQAPLQADRLVIGLFIRNGVPIVGMAMFDNDCLVRDLLTAMSASKWLEFSATFGISPADFTADSGT